MDNKTMAVQEAPEVIEGQITMHEVEEVHSISAAEMPQDPGTNNLGIWSDPERFEFAQRKAKALAESTLVPKAYHRNIANTLIAIDISDRVKISPLAVMQNLYIVNGNPAWSSQFVVTMINNSRRFTTPLKFKLEGEKDSLRCYAYATGRDGQEVRGITVTMQMARDEGWIAKSGSKWKTMPEQMIQYRAASFFGRLHCPDLLMGIYAEEEAASIVPDNTRLEVPNIAFDRK